MEILTILFAGLIKNNTGVQDVAGHATAHVQKDFLKSKKIQKIQNFCSVYQVPIKN